MATYVSPQDWANYEAIINNFIDTDAGLQPFLWLRKINQPLAFGEDGGIQYQVNQLNGLFHYNYIKTWPSGHPTISGELDYTNLVLYISANLLRSNNLLNNYGYWDFNWAEDRFVLNGKVYAPGGDTQVAQAGSNPLLFFVILYREDPSESEKILNTYINSDTQVINNQGIWLLNFQGKQIRDLNNLPLPVKGPPDIPVFTLDGIKLGNIKK